MTKPLVSIGIPVFNEGEFIEETLRSALSQDYEHIEVLVADNHSTDLSANIIERIAATDRRVKFVRNHENIGAPENFRLVRDLATGKFFMWLGAHDLLESSFIGSAVAELLANSDAAMAFPKCNFVDATDTRVVVMSGDSDIDTRGKSIFIGPLHVATQLRKCSAFHGLFRSGIIKDLPIEAIYGADDLILFLAATYGPIIGLDDIGLLRRHPREDESMQARNERYREAKVIRAASSMNRTITAAYHLKWIWKLRHFTLAQRLKLSRSFLAVYRQRYRTSRLAAIIATLRLGSQLFQGELPTPAETLQA